MPECQSEGCYNSLDMTNKEKVFFVIADCAVRAAKNSETEKTAKGIRAFYQLEKSNGNNPDPFLYSCYAGALFPGRERNESFLEKLKEFAYDILT